GAVRIQQPLKQGEALCIRGAQKSDWDVFVRRLGLECEPCLSQWQTQIVKMVEISLARKIVDSSDRVAIRDDVLDDLKIHRGDSRRVSASVAEPCSECVGRHREISFWQVQCLGDPNCEVLPAVRALEVESFGEHLTGGHTVLADLSAGAHGVLLPNPLGQCAQSATGTPYVHVAFRARRQGYLLRDVRALGGGAVVAHMPREISLIDLVRIPSMDEHVDELRFGRALRQVGAFEESGGNTDVCLDAIGPPTGEVRAAFAPSPGGSVESLPRSEGDLRSPDGDHVGAVVPGNGS